MNIQRKVEQGEPNHTGDDETRGVFSSLGSVTSLANGEHPGTIAAAEESTSFPGVSRPVHLGGLGFTYKWNMGWMHDILAYLREDPIHRRWHHNRVTFSALYMHSENFILPFSHDEVVHGKGSLIEKMPGDIWQKHAS